LKINQRKSGAVLSYVNIFVHFAIALVYTPVMLRLLGQENYGVYSLCVSAISYLHLFSFGFSNTYIRYYLKYKTEALEEKLKQLNGMFFCIFSVISFIVVIVSILMTINAEYIFGQRINSSEYKTVKILLSLMTLNLVITLLGSIFNSLIAANERFVFQKTLILISYILNPFVSLPFLLMGYGSIAMVIVQTVINTVIFAVNIVFCLTKLRIQFVFRKFDFLLLKELTGFSFFIFLQSLMDIFNWQIDKLLLVRFWGAAAVAVYSVGAQFNALTINFSTALSSVFIPVANKLVAQKKSDAEISDIFIKTGRIQFIIVGFIMLAFIFFGKSGVFFFAGAGYENAYYVALFLMMPLVVPLSQELGLTIMRAKAKHKMQMVINVGVALLNFLISIPLCKAFGEIGAAMGTFIGMIIASNILQSIYYYKVGRLDITRWLKQIGGFAPALIIPVIFGIVIMLFINTTIVFKFVLFAVLFTVVYFVSIWFIGMNSYEKRLVSEPIKKIIEKIKR
jgi:O-antigen/teichoic acid export membrane protein